MLRWGSVAIGLTLAFVCAFGVNRAAVAQSQELPGSSESPQPPAIFKWVDENGIPHYTTDRDRIPSSIRDRVRSVPRSNPAPAAAATAAGSAAGAAAASSPYSAPTGVADRPGSPTATGASALPPPTAAIDDSWATRDRRPQRVSSPGSRIGEPGEFLAEAAALDPEQQAELDAIDRDIASLEDDIAQDEEVLMSMISVPDAARDERLAQDEEFREIAQRLPNLQADLNDLRKRRDRITQ